jgi:2'-5' RNA ligase
MATERLFLALSVPDGVRRVLATLTEPAAAGLAWTHPAQLHLTLRFLGDVPEETIPRLIDELATVRIAPFLLPIEGVGAFPPRPPARVLWAGVAHADPRLFQLRQQVDDALLRTALPVDLRNFHPHVTLARVGERAAPAAARWLRTHAEFAAPPFRAEHFDLFASRLEPAGAVHVLKHRFPLAR